jgi:hypothetical protein
MYLVTRHGVLNSVGFIELLELVTTKNYSTVTNSHTLQFTIARIKPSVSLLGVAWQRISTVSSAPVVEGWLPSHDWCSTDLSLPMTYSESELLYDWWFTPNQFVLAPKFFRLATRVFFN